MKRTILATLVAGLMLATVFSACISAGATAADPVERLEGTVSWLKIIPPSATPLENAVVYIAGGHIDVQWDPFHVDLDLLINHTITDENGDYAFEDVAIGLYTVIVIGPNAEGEPVFINMQGGILNSSFIPNGGFTQVFEDETTTEDYYLLKRPFKQAQAQVQMSQFQMLLK